MSENGRGLLMTPAQRQQAFYQGLLGFAGGVLAGNQPSLVPGGQTPRALGLGLTGFQRGMASEEDRTVRQGLLGAQYAELQRKTAEAQQQQQALAGLNIDDNTRRMLIAGGPRAIASYVAEQTKARAPTVQEFFDPQGRPYKAQFDPATGAWSPVGGSKTDVMSPEAVAQKKDIATAGRTLLNVDARSIGPVPAGQRLVRGPDGSMYLEDIPGGPAAEKKAEKAKADETQAEQTGRYGGIVLEDIDRARARITSAPWYSPTTGLLGNILKTVGGTNAADVKALATTVQASIGFDRLQQMREASPTGGALGNITERELVNLQATLGSLEQSQSEKQLLENLDRLSTVYSDIMKKAAAYPNAAQFGFDKATKSTLKPPMRGQVIEGWKFKGGNPADQNSWEPVR